MTDKGHHRTHLPAIASAALACALFLTASRAQTPQLAVERANDLSTFTLRLSGGDNGDAIWQLQVSSDLVNWSDAESISSDGTSWEVTPSVTLSPTFFRAIGETEEETPGLYDLGSYRVMNLDFDDATWLSQLTTNYGTDVNVSATLTVEGTAYEGIGVRFKGDTSYRNATTTKKSFAIEVDDTDTELRLMGYKSLNLNNGYSDASFMREVLYNNFCREYVPSPKTNFVHLFVNGSDYGVYINAQQENGDFIEEVFADKDGDRWRAGLVPSTSGTGGGPPTGGPGGGGPGGGGAGGGAASLNFGGDLSWLGSDNTLYESGYTLKTDKNPDPWTALVTMIDVLNNTALDELPETLESVMAVDRFLWLIALENLFLDSDGYLAKAGDYLLYHDVNTGRLHPIQHDGNETFNADADEIAGGISAPPLYGEDLIEERPLTARLFAIDAYRQRYLAHLRTILNESYHWDYFAPRIEAYAEMIEADVLADSTKQTSNAAFLASINTNSSDLRDFVEDRRSFLLNHADLDRESPIITTAGLDDNSMPVAATPTKITATIDQGPAIRAATLYYTEIRDGAYTRAPMSVTAEGSYQAEIPETYAGTTVYYYVEAEADDAVGTRAYFPSRAEGAPLSFQVGVELAEQSQIVINELMADNEATLADSAGEFDDWIELYNLGDEAIDLGGMYLSDKVAKPRKWAIPEGTIIEPNGYLLIWADDDTEQEGLHAEFKLSSSGETVTLVDSDARGNLLLDTVTFGELGEDVSYGRTGDDGTLGELTPTPNAEN